MGSSVIAEACSELGFGLRLQREFIDPILRDEPPIDWLEIITENWLDASPTELESLQRLRRRLPIVLHGLSLAIGAPDPLDGDYLARLKRLADHLRAPWISDHLSGGHRSDDHGLELTPVPRTRASLAHLLPRIREVQHRLERPLLLENIPHSGPARPKDDEMDDWTFVAEIAEGSGSLILLDLDNLYQSAIGEGRDPMELLRRLPSERICQLHLSNRPDPGELPAKENPVWDLYRRALPLVAPVNTMLEPANNLPPLSQLLEDLAEVRALAQSCESPSPAVP